MLQKCHVSVCMVSIPESLQVKESEMCIQINNTNQGNISQKQFEKNQLYHSIQYVCIQQTA